MGSHDYVAEKSHQMLSANWKTRNASDIILFKSKGLRTRNSHIEGRKGMFQLTKTETRFTTSTFLLYSDLDDAFHIGMV
jgi:hypothetical protein